MKKRLIFSAVIALLTLSACQKDNSYNINEDEEIVAPVFTASIDSQDTKTTIDFTEGKVSWEVLDVIEVTDNNGVSAIYKIKSIDDEGKATFIIKDDKQPTFTGNSFSATYGTEPVLEQTYSSTAGKLYMTAPSTESRSFTFTVQCGLLKINLTKTDESVKSISVTNTDGTKTYKLTCDKAIDISSAKDFYIAVEEGSYTNFVITNSSDQICDLNAKAPIAISANHIKPVTLTEKKLKFYKPGVFSVGTSKTISFAKGNLYWNGLSYAIEETQYATAQYATNHVSNLYHYKTDAADKPYSENAWKSGYRAELNETEGNVTALDNAITGYRLIKKSEFEYLLGNSPKRLNRNALKTATIDGQQYSGLFLYPDDYNGNKSESTWAQIEARGIVFIPDNLGGRNGNSISHSGSYTYFTIKGNSMFYYFRSSSTITGYSSNDHAGIVRLVKDNN